MENDTGEGSLTALNTQVEVSRKVNAAQQRKESFIPTPGYAPNNRIVHGTPENSQMLADAFKDDETKELFQHSTSALAHVQKYAGLKKEWDTKAQSMRDKYLLSAGEPAPLAMQAEQEKHEQQKPKLSPYGSWLASLGATPNEIVTEVVKRNDKASFHFAKYAQLGLGKLIENNPGVLEDPVGLAELMKANGYFNPETDEESFFKENASSPYAQRYGHSVWGKINATYHSEMLKSGFGPRSFPFQMAAGRKLNPNDADDQQAYVDFWDFSKTQDGGDFLQNVGHAMAGVAEDFLKSVFRTGAALDPRGNNLEYEFDGDFVEPTGPNFALKEKFLSQWRNLRKQFDDGRLGQTQDLFWGYRKFVDKGKKANEVNDIFDIEDPAVRKEVPTEMREFLETFRQIKSKGGFKHDIYGLTAATSFADGALQLTAGFALMALSTDPDSIVTEGMSQMPFYHESPHDNRVASLKMPRSGANRDISMEHLKARMRMLNHAYEWHNKADIWRDSGMIAPESLFDRELTNAAAGWADVSLLIGPGKLVAQKMFQKSFGKAIPALRVAQEVQKRYMTTVFNIEEAVRKGVKLPEELTNAIKAVQEEFKAAGTAISEQDAIRKIYDGHPVVIDPKTGGKVALEAGQLYSIAKKVSSAVDNTQAIRDQLARLAIEGRRIPQYSNRTLGTMKKVKDWLIASGDNTLDWAKVPTQQIYEFINSNGINVGKAVSRAEWESLKKEVGLSWRQFDPTDVAGWQRTSTLPIELGFNARYWTWRGIGTGLGWVGGVGQRFLDIVSTYGPDQTSTAVTVRNAAKLGQENMGVGVAQAPWYKAWSIAHAAPAIAKFVGGLGTTMKHIAEFKVYAAKLGGTKSGSALLAMYADTEKQILMLDTQIAAAAKNPAYATKADVLKLIARKEELIGKALWAKNTHMWTSNAFVSGTLGVMKNGIIHGLWNEGLMYMADSRNPGSGFGMTLGLTGINRTIHSGFVRQFSSGVGIKEKVNDSQVEFVGHLAEKFEFNDNQKRRWIELYMTEAQKAQQISAEKGEAVGVRYWAHSLEAINGLFRTRSEVELHDTGVIEGLQALYRDRQLRENPEFGKQLRSEFLAEANKLGLEGAEASTYADKKIETYSRFNSVQARKKQIADEVATIETEREKLAEVANKDLFALQQAATTMLQSIGLSAKDVRTEMVTGAHGETVKLIVDGVEISELEGSTPLPLRTKALEKIAILRSELHNINQKKSKSEAEVRRMNEKLERLKNEEASINSFDVTHAYRPGEVVVDEGNGTRLTSYKDGITIWEQDIGNGEWSTKIILDRKKFNLETAWEETIHALTFTENAHRGVAMFNQAFFGYWQIDPTDATKFVNARLDPKTLQLVDMPPQITKDLDTNIDLLTRFAESYSDGLSTNEKSVFMAKYRAGIEAFRRNPTDLRGIEPVMMELMADVYKYRKAMSSPFTSRLESTPSSTHGSFEAGPNVVGVKSPRLWQKFASGQLTLHELALEGRQLNGKELGLGLDPSDLTPEQDRMQKLYLASANFLRVFGLGGTFDTVNRNSLKAKAVQLGLIKDKPDSWWTDKTKEGETLFSNRNMYDADGNLIPIPDELVRSVSVIINDTRGHGSELRRNAFPTEEQIKENESSNDPDSVAARVNWAFSTGRRSWINAAGQFKRPFWELMQLEHEPIRDFFRAVITDTNKKGETFGLRVQRIGQGGFAIAGTPNLEQSAAIRRYFKEKILKDKQAGDVPTTYDNMLLFMNSMAEGNRFDPKAQRPGELLAFNATYRPRWASKDLAGAGSSRSQYVDGYSRDLNFVPFAMIIKDSTFDFEGNVMTQTHKNGKPVKDKNGNPIAESLPQIMFWCLDLDALEDRRIKAMRGLLKDGNGIEFFEKGEMFELFGKDFNLYQEAFQVALANWSTAGSFDKNSKEYGPPQRTWMALLPLTKNSRGKTSEHLAKTWAMAIQRIMGFPTNNFRELTLLEREVLTKKQGDRDLTPEELRAKKLELKALREKHPEASSDVDEALAKAGAKIGRNEFGEADDMQRQDSAFFMMRADRVDGVAQPLVDGNGYPTKLSFSNWGSLAGSISWSTNNWSQIPKEGVSKITSGYNLSGAVFHNGWSHSSGYQVFLMQDRSEKGGKLSKKKYVVFDSQRRVVNPFNITDLNDAFRVASEHSEQNPQIPITGNRFEEGMIEEGWLPKGMNVSGFMRDRFVHGDGVWQLQRAKKGGKYELMHIPTGFIIAEGLNITEENPKLPAINLGDVNAAILEARTNNTIIARVNAEKYAKLKKDGIHEYTVVPEVNSKGELKNVQVPFGLNNNAYWQIKRMLVNGTSTSAGFGLKRANEILQQMKDEIGADVAERDPAAVINWFEKWSTEFERSLSPAELERLSNEAKAVHEKEAVDVAHAYAQLKGQKLIFEKPKAYTKATMVNSEGKVPPEWLDANGQLTAQMQKYFADKYAEELASWELQERARKGTSATEVEGVTLAEEKDWVGSDSQLELNYRSLLTEIGIGIAKLKADTESLTAEARRKIQGRAMDVEGQDVATKVGKIGSNALALGEQAKSQWLTNQLGYMIQASFFKEPKMPLGIEFTVGKIGLFSNRAAEGSNWVFQGPSQLPKTKFIAYSPYGVIIGTYGSVDAANEAIMDYELNRTAEDAKWEVQLKEMANPGSTSGKVQKTENVYQEYIKSKLKEAKK